MRKIIFGAISLILFFQSNCFAYDLDALRKEMGTYETYQKNKADADESRKRFLEDEKNSQQYRQSYSSDGIASSTTNGTVTVGNDTYDYDSEITINSDGSYAGSVTIDGETEYYDSYSDDYE